MALTDTEKLVARTATNLTRAGDAWGILGQGWCPEGLVALMRGATPIPFGAGQLPGDPRLTFQDFRFENGAMFPIESPSAQIAWQAQKDCMDWAGFAPEQLHEYLLALRSQGTAIFPQG